MDALLIDQNTLAHTHTHAHPHRAALGKDAHKYFSFTLWSLSHSVSFISVRSTFIKQTVQKTVLTAAIRDSSKPPKGDRWLNKDDSF